MRLKNSIIIKGEYRGSTKFEFWKDLIVGDEVEISIELVKTGSNRGKIYAPEVYGKNSRSGREFSTSINAFQNYLDRVDWEEVED